MSLFRKLVGVFQAAGLSIRKRLLGGLPALFVEDVFSTYLYTTTGSDQTITNNIDLSTYGGLVWVKGRSAVKDNVFVDTVRGVSKSLVSNTSNAEDFSSGNYVKAFSTTGFTVSGIGSVGGSGTFCTWTFRKQPKFFDIVTYTGNGTSQTISHNLASTPGCIFVKRTDTTANWIVYHRGLSSPNGIHLKLNSDATQDGNNGMVNGTSSTTFSIGGDPPVNASGGTYVAYLFAHDAGGFGLTGTDNVISCGSFTSNASGGVAAQNLGYEPQFIIWKSSSSVDSWRLLDNTRGMWVGTPYNASPTLFPNLSSAESNNEYFNVSGTGFSMPDGSVGSSTTFVYIAIRRGPMKVPTVGTSVFSPVARAGTGATAQITGIGFTPDFIIGKPRTGYNVGTAVFDRLRGTSKYLAPSWIDDEITDTTMVTSFNMDGVSLGADTVQKYFNGSGGTYINWLLKRAPSFFDEVCYTGTGNNTTITHNLGVVPELIFVKRRTTSSAAWVSYSSALANTEYLVLNTTAAKATGATIWNSTTPTSSVFSVGTSSTTNGNTNTYVAYLFATCAGVSKVGSYTGNGGSSQDIDCGFTSGARFVLVKAASGAGDWWVWDTARGITSGNDGNLRFNTADDEVTTLDFINPLASGFTVVGSDSSRNGSGVQYIFLAIA